MKPQSIKLFVFMFAMCGVFISETSVAELFDSSGNIDYESGNYVDPAPELPTYQAKPVDHIEVRTLPQPGYHGNGPFLEDARNIPRPSSGGSAAGDVVGAVGAKVGSKVLQKELFGKKFRAIDGPEGAGTAADGSHVVTMETDEAAQCDASAKIAYASCATMSLLGMDPETASAMEGVLAAIPSLISAMKSSSSNAEKQCKDQKKMNEMMAIVSAAKNAACLMTMGKCIAQCEAQADIFANSAVVASDAGNVAKATEDKAVSVAARKKQLTCKAFKANSAGLILQTFALTRNALTAGKCAKELGLTPITVPNIPTYDPGTTQIAGCDNAQFAAANPQCICATDPKNKICPGGGNNDWNQGGTGAGGTSNAGGISAPGTDDFSDLGDGKAVDETKYEAKTAGPGKDPEGGGGGGPSGGNGAGLNGQGDGGGGAPVTPTSVITGQSNGGGGNSLLAPGGTGGGGNRGMASSSDEDNEKLLRGLVPRGGFADRSTAGMSIPAVDGMTAPMGPSIWEKVSSQVQNQESKQPFLK
jgi:hypothetical protein